MSQSAKNVFEDAMALLRQFGWDVGYRKLQEWLPMAADHQTRCLHQLFLGWQALERGRIDESIGQFKEILDHEDYASWGYAGLAFAAYRQKRLAESADYFAEATRHRLNDDPELTAVLAMGQGSLAYQRADLETAREHFVRALEICGSQHFLSGRLFDALGSTWLSAGSFYYALEFYHRSLEIKQSSVEGDADLAGLALTHGQLGRLYLRWGLLEQAKTHFEEDLKLCDRLDDVRGRTQMLNHLGQVATRRAEFVYATGNPAQGKYLLEEARGWLDSSIAASALRKDWNIVEGYGRKDRAIILVLQHEFAAAEVDLKRSEELFHESGFSEGLAHVDMVRGILARRQGMWEESLRLLNKSLRFFTDHDPFLNARTLLEVARTRRDSGDTRPVVTSAYLSALEHAERSRFSQLVQEIERDLDEINPLERLRREYQRARGRLVTAPTSSLLASERETGSVLYLDIQGSTQFVRQHDPEVIQLIFNQLMADLESVLRKHGGQVSGYRGDGFLALFRGVESSANHALRAVRAAFDLYSCVEKSNQPRSLLGLSRLDVRVGVATGELCFGNVGTYDKMDYSVVGNAANLGARLEAQARTDTPCISDLTRDAIGSLYELEEAHANLRGFGEQRFWYVRRPSKSS